MNEKSIINARNQVIDSHLTEHFIVRRSIFCREVN